MLDLANQELERVFELGPGETMAGFLAAIPLGRLQPPEHIADLVSFLAQADDVTGQAIHVDGGMQMP